VGNYEKHPFFVKKANEARDILKVTGLPKKKLAKVKIPVEIKNRKSSKRKKTFAIIDPKVGNYEKHPFFVKKANEAKAFLKKVGLPKKLANTK
jgi:hypothetical protein